MRQFITFMFFSSLLMSCASQSTFEDYVFGFSAEESDRFMFVRSVFDERIAVPAGVVGCCLSSSGKTAALFQKFYPSIARIEWYDFQDEQYRTATMQYPENLQQIVFDMNQKVESSSTGGLNILSPVLITSISSDNYVISWVAITSWEGLMTQREIIEIGRAKGEVFVPDWLDDPEYSVSE